MTLIRYLSVFYLPDREDMLLCRGKQRQRTHLYMQSEEVAVEGDEAGEEADRDLSPVEVRRVHVQKLPEAMSPSEFEEWAESSPEAFGEAFEQAWREVEADVPDHIEGVSE